MKNVANERRHDVVLYGASGFVGRQTVAYFVQHGRGLHWALAGRSADRLAAVQRDTGASMAGVCGAVVVQVDFLRGQRGQALMNQCVQRQGFAHVRTPA